MASGDVHTVQEFVPDKYVVPFAPELAGAILERSKVITYRFGDKYDYLQVGDEVSVQNSATQEVVGKASIVNKKRLLFKDLPLDGASHESYKSKHEQRKLFSGYYAYLGRPIEDDDSFLALGFQLIDKS